MQPTETHSPLRKVRNSIEYTAQGIWVLPGEEKFDYSDGVLSERRLTRILTRASDLSSDSEELQQEIVDWTTEYHLTSKRAQLLREFTYDRSARVLEVGCGCGAITRFLGETFDDVTAVEGSRSRAAIARLRCRDLPNVSIISAPFQKVNFGCKFDIIFCIGVLEYSNHFVDAEDPCAAVLEHLSDMLSETGELVVAIENQFGLKYFASCTEDHTNRMFEGIEGYPNYGNGVRTYGLNDLKARLGRNFASSEFYFPLPDYKLPSCILSERLVSQVDVSELASKFPSRDYSGRTRMLFSEERAMRELCRNGMMPFFANSFLVVSRKGGVGATRLGPLGVLYATERPAHNRVITKFVEGENGEISVQKSPVFTNGSNYEGEVRVRKTTSVWRQGRSLARSIEDAGHDGADISDVAGMCRSWLEALRAVALNRGGQYFLPGRYVDATWQNTFVHNGQCSFIDDEWEWHREIPIELLLIRSIYIFKLADANRAGAIAGFRRRTVRQIASEFGSMLNLHIDRGHFNAFVEIESALVAASTGHNRAAAKVLIWASLHWTAVPRHVTRLIRRVKKCRETGLRFSSRVARIVQSVW